MHRLFFIDEITLAIVNHVPADRDLSVLARVCQSFSEPALDVLWAALHSIVPLLKCLPPDLIEETLHDKQRLAAYTLKRPFTTTDWNILLKYARRVTALISMIIDPVEASKRGRFYKYERVDDAIFGVLCNPPFLRLFPKLRKLVWCDLDAREPLAFLRLLLVPSISDLTVVVERLPMDVCTQSLIVLLPNFCPAVENFCWVHNGIVSRTSDALRSPARVSNPCHRLRSSKPWIRF
ncbi:hypothetical protein CONPUDRAFT_167527 [Coniophora puteana RWD-64-598 SS2]|uniref:F-box domain-containing protein n=1 Tax=Coniophora puteana (strain RWD-64-598) TaxID=741705 RepID=A0A5M3MHF1_CONPW|nr:uncharacterized protein CONPUDRAFT_167527 [Coniophora puteana RWD-64-598 SS2]EIW78533.1 hypothetical protein CONPUDRAFT_167527 [Coniophora puteana RWD-64-598 SS2]